MKAFHGNRRGGGPGLSAAQAGGGGCARQARGQGGGRGRGRGDPGMSTQQTAERNWEPWRLQLRLPAGEVVAPFCAFACCECRQTLVEAGSVIFFGDPDPAGGDDPNQVLWVQGLPKGIKLGAEFQNRVKGLLGWNALCKTCGKQVGSRYMSCPPHVVSGVGECCKLTFRRDSYPGGKTGPMNFGVIPLGDRAMLEEGGLIAQAASPAAAGNEAMPQLDLSEVEVRCRHCEAVLCSASTLRLDGTDAVLPAHDAGDRVRFETHSEPQKKKQGFRKSICTACDHDLGNEKKGRVLLKLRSPAKVILMSVDGQCVSREDWMQLSRSAPAQQQGRQGRRGHAPVNARSAPLPAVAPRLAVPVRDEAAERTLTEPIPMAQAFEAPTVRLHVFPCSDII